MSETPLTPERFARLMSLPADHPERMAWSGRPEFESLRALYQQFEADPSAVPERELRQAVAVLERRFRDVLGAEPRSDAPEPRPAIVRRGPVRAWWRLPRPALAMAAAMVVVVGGAWLAARPRSPALRGAGDAPVIQEPHRVDDGLELAWSPVAGAEAYRLSFVDSSMREVAAVDDCRGTRYRLQAATLPPGLVHGAEVMLQIQPVRAGLAAGAAGARSIRVP